MKFKLLVVASFLALTSCKQPAQTVVLAGDSWASLLCYHKSFDKAFKEAGIHDASPNSSCVATTMTGVRADDWLGNKFHKATRLALLDPSVKVLFFSIGGNDVLNYWNKNMTAAEENVVLDKVAGDIEAIVKDYQAARPDIKIIISGYDFPRFTDDNPIKEYREGYESMGKPTAYELNTAVLRFSERVSKIADQKSVFYIHHYGLMHYYRGNSEHSLAPGQTLSPEMISSPNDVDRYGGDVNLLADTTSMMQVTINGNVLVNDAFHLSRFGYDKMAEHTVFHYLKDWLKPQAQTKK